MRFYSTQHPCFKEPHLPILCNSVFVVILVTQQSTNIDEVTLCVADINCI